MSLMTHKLHWMNYYLSACFFSCALLSNGSKKNNNNETKYFQKLHVHIDHHFRKTAFSNFNTEQQNFNCTPITGSWVAGFLKRIWIRKKIEETPQWSDSYGTIFQLENNSSLARLIFFLMLHIFFYQFLKVAQNIIKHWNLLKGLQQAMNKIYWYWAIKKVFLFECQCI